MIRLYIKYKLLPNYRIKLDPKQAHYLFKVMRKPLGSKLQVFNQSDGEYEAVLGEDHLQITQILRLPVQSNSKAVALASIKKDRLECAVEKLTEIGIGHIYILHTDYSQRIIYNYARLEAITMEAAEQSHNLRLPTLHQPRLLREFLELPLKMSLFHQDGPSRSDLAEYECAVIGPEGGWSPSEMNLMSNLDKTKLGDSILRSETAATVAGYLLTAF